LHYYGIRVSPYIDCVFPVHASYIRTVLDGLQGGGAISNGGAI
jgi:hypothetical protein